MSTSKTPPPTVAQLRKLVRSSPGTPGRPEAFAELVERAPRDLTRTLVSVARDLDEDRGMRVKAVAALGHVGSPAAIESLCELATDSDGVVARRAIERLGKVGRPDDLAVIKALKATDATTERALRTAKLFLSYRHGLSEYRLDVPRRTLAAGHGESAAIRTGAPTKTMLNHLELLAPQAPGVEVGGVPARRLVCGANEYALMLDRRLDSVGSLTAGQAVPAVLLLQNIETGAYEPAYYFMTDPTGADSFRVSGVRSSGRVGLHGTATVSGTLVQFEVHATEEPLDHPVTVAGTFDAESGAVRFEVAVTDTEFSDRQQRRRRQPRRVDRPDP